MKFTEKMLTILVAIGFGLNIFHMKGGLESVMIAVLGLALLYLFFGFLLFNGIRLRKAFERNSYAGLPTFNIIAGVVSGIFMAVMVMGVMFKIMHWPGGMLMCAVGVGVNLLLAAAAYRENKWVQPKLPTNILIRMAIIAVTYFVIMPLLSKISL